LVVAPKIVMIIGGDEGIEMVIPLDRLTTLIKTPDVKLKIESERRPNGTKVFINDTNVGSICTGISVKFDIGAIPEATISLIPKVVEIESDVNLFVKIGEKKYRLLEENDG